MRDKFNGAHAPAKKPARPPALPDVPSASAPGDALRTLAAALARLGELQSGPARAPGADGTETFWDDDHYLYCESAVSTDKDCEIDISVVGGRCFVRVSRPV